MDEPRPPVRRWRGYAALSGADGAMVWGSLRPTRDEARRFFEHHNPMRPAVIVRVELKIIEDDRP